jgi:imidazolonepropionase-like amidohydrolase
MRTVHLAGRRTWWRGCRALRWLLVLPLGLAPSTDAAEASGPVLVLRAARLFDGTGTAALTPGMLRIEGDRIAAVGQHLPLPAGGRLIELGDATLLPGLIDLHTHLCSKPGVHWEDELVRSDPAEAALWGAHHALRTLRAGFTTCREMGPTWPYVDVALRNAIDSGAVPGPRLVVSGNYVSPTGGAGDARQFSLFVDVPTVRNLADGADEVLKAVRTNFKHGADFIKILVTGAVLSKGMPPGAQQYTDAEIRAATEEARRWGRFVAAHAHGADGIKAAIRAGVRTVDHGTFLDDETVSLLRDNPGSFYVPTLYTSDVILEHGVERGIPAAEVARERALRQTQDAGFQRALRAGLPIGFGTDAGVIPHGENARELLARARLGERPLAGLRAATGLNARILGLDDRLGSLTPGLLADVIAVPGDALTDLAALTRVGFVMKGGQIVRDELSKPR